MRLWTLHPKYLDPPGLIALWREALLARAVLGGKTRGYKHHPQLDRFRPPAAPSSIDAYLAGIFEESVLRGYSFDRRKIGPVRDTGHIEVMSGQVGFEWQHLLRKLSSRSPVVCKQWKHVTDPETHPVFRIVPGTIEPWERP